MRLHAPTYTHSSLHLRTPRRRADLQRIHAPLRAEYTEYTECKVYAMAAGSEAGEAEDQGRILRVADVRVEQVCGMWDVERGELEIPRASAPAHRSPPQITFCKSRPGRLSDPTDSKGSGLRQPSAVGQNTRIPED
ncbi:hypothetical protein AB1N83_013832 [Pleurotus pulmonarius]